MLAKDLIKKMLWWLSFKEKKWLDQCFSRLSSCSKMTLVDVGAAGDVQPRWKQIIDHVNYIGFEPDRRSFEELPQRGGCKYFNTGVWSYDGHVKINLCRGPCVSSVLKPRVNFLSKFRDANRFDILNEEEIKVSSLENVVTDGCDFVKLDIQGGELEAIKGMQVLLFDCVGFEIEVEFIDLYHDQPLFGEITQYLASYHFQFVDFTNICRWERHRYKGAGQAVFGDALYLKSPEWVVEHLNEEKTAYYIQICILYKRFDLVDVVMQKTKFECIKSFADSVCYKKLKAKYDSSLNWIRLFTWILRLKFGGQFRCHLIY